MQEGSCQILFTSLVSLSAEASLEDEYSWEDASPEFTRELLTIAYLPLRPGTRTATGGSAAGTTSWSSCAADRLPCLVPSQIGATARMWSPTAPSAPASTSSTSAQVHEQHSCEMPGCCHRGRIKIGLAYATNWGRTDQHDVMLSFHPRVFALPRLLIHVECALKVV